MTTNSKRIDLAIDAIVNDNSAEALGHLMLYKMEQITELKNPPIEVDVANAPEVLPPMVPIRNRERKPIDFKCPTCGAKPGHPCVKISTRGKEAKDGPKALGEPLQVGKRHSSRRRLWNESRGVA